MPDDRKTPDPRKTLGKKGEAAAQAFLQTQGFAILETNFRTKPAEIDIIAQENNCICFIEVKTRQSLKKGLPRESITPAKQKKIILGACLYLKKNNRLSEQIRFDVVEVYMDNGKFDINFIKNAFQAE
jgi:putative endonuclease